MAENLIAAQIISFPPRKVKGWPKKVVDPATADAAQVIVSLDVAIEAGLAVKLQLLHRPHPNQ